jgi:hypothetical protein
MLAPDALGTQVAPATVFRQSTVGAWFDETLAAMYEVLGEQ